MNQQELESIFDETFNGLTVFYRDMQLSESLISKYFLGQILTERGYTDMSWKVGGLIKNLRYAIASSFGVDLSAINREVAKFGLTILKRDSYFKVLDNYRIGEKTQILLLHIPPHSVGIFKTVQTNFEEQVRKKV